MDRGVEAPRGKLQKDMTAPRAEKAEDGDCVTLAWYELEPGGGPVEDEGCPPGTAQEDAGTAEMRGRGRKGIEGADPSPPHSSLSSPTGTSHPLNPTRSQIAD